MDTKIDIESEPVNKKCKLSESKDEPGTSHNKEVKQEDDEESSINVEDEIPEEGFIYPLDMDASDMLDEVEFEDGRFPSVTERYFTPYYQIDVQKPGDDVCIRIHSNRICMISLAPSHMIFQENKTIASCNFKVSDKLDRTKNKVSGKAKHGAQPLQSNSNLCCLTCTDESTYMVKCCMIGKLVEVNERLVQDPELLKQEPHFGGYIAIALPNLKHFDKLQKSLLTQEQYEEALKKRKELVEEKTNKETEQIIIAETCTKQEQKNGQTINEENVSKQKEEVADMEIVEKTDNVQCINVDSIINEKKEHDGEVTSMEIV